MKNMNLASEINGMELSNMASIYFIHKYIY